VLLALACGANDDLFRQANDSKVSLRRARMTGSNTNRTVEWEDEDRMTDDWSLVSGLNARYSDGAGPSTRPHLSSDPRRARCFVKASDIDGRILS